MNMNPNLTRYQGQLQAWMPGARIVPPNTKFPTVDAMVEWKGPLGPVRYIAEWKAHFRYQDAAVIADQLKHWRGAAAPPGHSKHRLLLCPPHRPPQRALLSPPAIHPL